MKNLEHILYAHASRYPLMEPADAVKLVYQHVFGGGHLIRDPEECSRRLWQEYAATPRTPGAPVLEPIGNGLVRVMLGALEGTGYSVEQLGRDFLASAGEHRGERETFLQKLEVLRGVAGAGAFGFSQEALDAYLAGYKRAGCPAVSHSDRYRQAYRPAYRVVQAKRLPEELTAGPEGD